MMRYKYSCIRCQPHLMIMIMIDFDFLVDFVFEKKEKRKEKNFYFHSRPQIACWIKTMMSSASLLRLGSAAAKRSVFSCNTTSVTSIACRSMSEKASSTTSSVRLLAHRSDDVHNYWLFTPTLFLYNSLFNFPNNLF